jgi:elongation factor P--beta-lysine ligase
MEKKRKLHNPEFNMIEWYKSSCSFDEIIHDTVALIKLFFLETFLWKHGPMMRCSATAPA